MTPRINFSLTQLEYVLAVKKHGHFAKAAAACHVTQPTLSMQIQKLEEDLGVVLFDRSKKPILMTEAGEKLIAQFQSVLFEARKIEGIIQTSQDKKTSGTLKLGVIPTIAPYLLPLIFSELEVKYPGIELTVLELQTERIIDALNNDEIDVGLLATPLKIAKIHEHALYYEPFYVMCQKGHELARLKKVKHSHLKSDDVWLLEEGHCLRNQVLDVCAIKKTSSFKRQIQFESGSLETLKHIVSQYGGYTLLPGLATAELPANSVLIPFERPIPAREVGLVHLREHYKSELIDALAEVILASIPEDIRRIRPKDLEILPI